MKSTRSSPFSDLDQRVLIWSSDEEDVAKDNMNDLFGDVGSAVPGLKQKKKNDADQQKTESDGEQRNKNEGGRYVKLLISRL